MEKEFKVIVHYVVEAVVDFTYGRLRNEYAIDALPYIANRLDLAAHNQDESVRDVIVFQRDKHEATEEAYLQSDEGKRFPYFHCPVGDPGMELVDELKQFEPAAFRAAYVDKAFIFDSVTVETLQDIYGEYGGIDEIHFYGFLTGMCVTGAAILARAYFQAADIYVHSRGTADLTPELHKAALDALERNFIFIAV